MPVVMNTHTTALLELVVNMGTVATRDGGHTLHIRIYNKNTLYIVNVHIPVITKLKRAFAFLLSKGICLVDFGVLRELTIGFYLCGVSIDMYSKMKIASAYSCEPHPPCISL